MMAMVGVIKVESSSNIDAIKLKAESYKKTFFNESRKIG
jgi:hypothetical protein